MASKALTYFKVFVADCIVGRPVGQGGLGGGLRCLRFNFGFIQYCDMACYKYLQHFDKVEVAATIHEAVSEAVAVSAAVAVSLQLFAASCLVVHRRQCA